LNKPVVALIGRPNVGKSTLFNRLAGERQAIVDDVPGTTRDRLFTDTEWNGRSFFVVDTGGIDPSTGSKLPLSIGSAEYIRQIRTQVDIAINDADAILFLTDAISGVTPADQEVAQILRSHKRNQPGAITPPIFLVVNKADNETLRNQAVQFYELGIGDPYPISAFHGTGTGDLLDDLVAAFPPIESIEDDESVKIAIVGKPNVGKSSLLNRLVGKERAIVSPIAGTTRDAIDTTIEYNDIPITLIDTAGIRRRGRIDPGVEKYSVIRSLRAIERSDVALLMIDAASGITAQDAHIAGFIVDAWKSTVILINKWDTVEKDNYTINEFSQRIMNDLNFIPYAPLLFISAKTGQRVDQVLPLALRVQEERMVRLSTSQINQVIHQAQDTHSPGSRSGHSLRIYYSTQVRNDPPTFMLYVNDPKLAHFTYLRYLENSIRRAYPFTGTPIRIVMKPRR
jgi:GTP-binding protein